MRIPDHLKVGRRGGAGPAGGRYILIHDSVANVPIFGFAGSSPLELVEKDGRCLVEGGDETISVDLLETPDFYGLETSDGTPMWKVALAHGKECLGSTVLQRCMRWRDRNQCKFCAIELSLESGMTIEAKKPAQLAEVAVAAQEEGFSHVTLTTGTPYQKDRGSHLLARATGAIKEATGMRVHVQIEPPPRENLEELRAAGADSIGIHIESLDRDTLRDVCPAKSKEWDDYFRTWEDALEVFGDNQVSSYVILGLGERQKETLAGIDRMCQLGVIPYVVPLRPLDGTSLQDSSPPPPGVMEEYYIYSAMMMRESGVDPLKNLAGCVRCGGCSALVDYYRG